MKPMPIPPIFAVLVLASVGCTVSCPAAWSQASAPATTKPAAPGSTLKSPAASGAKAAAAGPLSLLPLTVRDKKGKPIAGLTKQDFSLTEDARPETIQVFEPAAQVPLALALVVDTGETMSPTLDAERGAAKAAIDSLIGNAPGEALAGAPAKAAVLHFDHEVELLKDLTDAKAKLEEGLQELGPSQAPAPVDAANGDQGSGGDIGGGKPRYSANQLYDAIYLASNDLLATQPGRRVILLMSDGVDRGSKKSMQDAIKSAVNAGVEVYTIYFKGEEPKKNSSNAPGNGTNPGNPRRGVGFPGGWPGGGGGWPGGGNGGGNGGGTTTGPNGRTRPPEAAHVDGKGILGQIATKTGGWPFEAKKPEEMEGIARQIASELQQQYVLGYVPDPASRGAIFHRITVTMQDANAKDQFVQVREGYYGKDPDEDN